MYQQAPGRAEQGEHTLSTDELTGVQALERKHVGLPLAHGKQFLGTPASAGRHRPTGQTVAHRV